MTFTKTLALALSVTAAGFVATGCTTAPKNDEAKANLDEGAQAALKKMQRTTPGLETQLTNAHGYAIFPAASSAGLVVGGKFGRGEVYEKGTFIGYAKLEEGNVGAQVGAKTFNELVIFENAAALDKFKNNQWSPSAGASAVILKAGVAANWTFKDGVAILIDPEGGAEAAATVGAQKFTYQWAEKK